MVDQTDREILRLLSDNARMQWQEIGEIVHLTGQAVKNRISRMEKLGILQAYTVKVNPRPLGLAVTAYVTIFMKTTEHAAFQQHLRENGLVTEAYRISGEGCYLLKVLSATQEELLDFLDGILKYGNYKVNLAMDQIK